VLDHSHCGQGCCQGDGAIKDDIEASPTLVSAGIKDNRPEIDEFDGRVASGECIAEQPLFDAKSSMEDSHIHYENSWRRLGEVQ